MVARIIILIASSLLTVVTSQAVDNGMKCFQDCITSTDKDFDCPALDRPCYCQFNGGAFMKPFTDCVNTKCPNIARNMGLDLFLSSDCTNPQAGNTYECWNNCAKKTSSSFACVGFDRDCYCKHEDGKFFPKFADCVEQGCKTIFAEGISPWLQPCPGSNADVTTTDKAIDTKTGTTTDAPTGAPTGASTGATDTPTETPFTTNGTTPGPSNTTVAEPSKPTSSSGAEAYAYTIEAGWFAMLLGFAGFIVV